MATLVLSTVGSIFGGPIGGMIGAMAGQYIDQNILFKPKAVHGPRLTDLAVQTSSYGTQIPRLYGRMRVAGTVIWATPLKESRKKHKAKGQPDQVTYSYSASFAVALSSRPIAGVGRIWADGTLIRSAGGRFTLDTGFHVHHGTPDQPADPLIASAQGISQTPAHRDLAYVVFEDLPLADFGNRIPSLSFELIADYGAMDGTAIMADMLPLMTDSGAGGFTPGGYAASGSSVKQAVQPILDASGLDLYAGRLTGESAPIMLPVDAAASAERKPWIEKKREPASTLPATIAVRHYDPARDWLVGLERAGVAGSAGGRETSIDCPMALGRLVAQSLAARFALRALEAQDSITLPLGPMAFALPAGCLLRLPDQGGVWRVRQWQWRGGSGELTLVRHATEKLWPVDPVVPPVEEGPGALHAALFDLPRWGGIERSASALLALAQASENGGGAVEVGIRLAGSSESLAVARAFDAPVLGFADTILPWGSAALCDTVSSVTVTLVNPDMMLAHASDAALFAGANAAMLGGELFQFGRADALPPDGESKPRYRLSHLLRGRGGTEDRMDSHGVGDAFALLDDGAGALALTLLPDRIGLQPVSVDTVITLRRPGSAGLVALSSASVGRALLPLAPVHLSATSEDGGGVTLRWVRRSRDGWLWVDGLDAPLDEPTEAYHILLTPDAGTVRPLESATPTLLLDAALLAIFAGEGAHHLTIAVQQVGQYGLSPPVSISMPLS